MNTDKELVIATLSNLSRLKTKEQFKLQKVKDQIFLLKKEESLLKNSIDQIEKRTEYELDKHKKLLE